MYQVISKFVTNTTFMNYPARFSNKNFFTGKFALEMSVKTIKVELEILATNRNAAEKLPQHLKYSQKWLSDILEIYEACGAQCFQAIKVRASFGQIFDQLYKSWFSSNTRGF